MVLTFCIADRKDSVKTARTRPLHSGISGSSYRSPWSYIPSHLLPLSFTSAFQARAYSTDSGKTNIASEAVPEENDHTSQPISSPSSQGRAISAFQSLTGLFRSHPSKLPSVSQRTAYEPPQDEQKSNVVSENVWPEYNEGARAKSIDTVSVSPETQSLPHRSIQGPRLNKAEGSVPADQPQTRNDNITDKRLLHGPKKPIENMLKDQPQPRRPLPTSYKYGPERSIFRMSQDPPTKLTNSTESRSGISQGPPIRVSRSREALLKDPFEHSTAKRQTLWAPPPPWELSRSASLQRESSATAKAPSDSWSGSLSKPVAAKTPSNEWSSTLNRPLEAKVMKAPLAELTKTPSAPSIKASSTPAEESHSPVQPKLTHVTSSGNAHMVDVTEKSSTSRVAIASGFMMFTEPDTLPLILENSNKKGDVLGVARIAGIMAAKRCSDIIPLCHPIAISKVSVDLFLLRPVESGDVRVPGLGKGLSLHGGIVIEARVHCHGPTGVEMEALTAVTGAALTVYDMCKAVDRGMTIRKVKLMYKEGGKSGKWHMKMWPEYQKWAEEQRAKGQK